MRLSGVPRRLELIPENDAEKQACQDIIDGKALVYWGDTENRGMGLVINSAEVNPLVDALQTSPVEED